MKQCAPPNPGSWIRHWNESPQLTAAILVNTLMVPFNLGKESSFPPWESPFTHDSCQLETGRTKKKKNLVYFFIVVCSILLHLLIFSQQPEAHFTHYWSIKTWKFRLLKHYKTQNIRKSRKKLNIVYCHFFLNRSILSFDYIT